MSRVLVTGANTTVSQGIVRALLADRRVEWVLAVGLEPSFEDPSSADPRLIYAPVDLSRSRPLRRLLHGPARAFGIDTVIHTALHRSGLDGGERVHRINVESTRRLLQLAEKHPTIERFVYRSYAEVYHLQYDTPCLIGEDERLELSPRAPQRVRDRVEADLTVCARMGMSPLHIVVLRLAEVLEPHSGSQLWDYLRSRVCLRPLGFDPMLNVLSLPDAVRATCMAMYCSAQGTFNIPGADTLPLSRLVRRWGCRDVPIPGPLLSPLYWMRARLTDTQFRYDLDAARFHFGCILDGERAAQHLGYTPQTRIDWTACRARAEPVTSRLARPIIARRARRRAFAGRSRDSSRGSSSRAARSADPAAT